MDDSEATSLEQIEAFLAGSGGAGTGRSIRLDGTHTGAASVSRTEQTGKGIAAPVCIPNDGPEPGAGDEADRRLLRHRACKGGNISADEVCGPLHESGRGTAGLCGQK